MTRTVVRWALSVDARCWLILDVALIHPFREGNGRTQRVFWNRIALRAGWQLDWRPVHGEENHAAARAGSDQLDLRPLIEMFGKVVTLPQNIGHQDWATQEIKRLSIGPTSAS
ncbi:Fic family protein [Subtercola boreus]